MAESQLHLFDAARPLLDRFGAEFFRAVPPRPGVYVMGGEGERILYVGQSKNLRQRLATYKNARSDRAPRKVIRLVHQVRTIEWQECETATAARLRENQLLRAHRPRFNVVNTWPAARRFICLRFDADRIEMRLTGEVVPDGRNFGAFKGGATPAFAALLRCLWTAWHRPATPDEFPHRLLATDPPRTWSFDLHAIPREIATPEWSGDLERFLDGSSDELVRRFAAALPDPGSISQFQRSLHSADLECLNQFFLRGPRRNYELHRRRAVYSPIIPQAALDDLLVLHDSDDRAHEPA